MVAQTSDPEIIHVRFSAESEPIKDPSLPMYTCRVKLYCHGGLGKSLELNQLGTSVESAVSRLKQIVRGCNRRSPRVKEAIIAALDRLE